MTHPDGTPLTLDDLPYRRLLAGLDAPPLLVRAERRLAADQGDAARRGRAAGRLDHRGRHRVSGKKHSILISCRVMSCGVPTVVTSEK